MKEAKVILVVCFVLAFAAGTALGLFIIKIHTPPEPHGLARELNLSPEQQDQMRKIWARPTEPASRGQRTAAVQQRDEAVDELLAKSLTEDQMAQYKQIQQDYQKKIDELQQARRQDRLTRIEQTKKMLTPDQAVKFDEWLKKQQERMDGGRSRRDAAETTPAAQQPSS